MQLTDGLYVIFSDHKKNISDRVARLKPKVQSGEEFLQQRMKISEKYLVRSVSEK